MSQAAADAVLDDAEVAAALATLAGWSGDTTALRRAYTAPDFLGGIRLVVAVAEAAEAAQHHPDIDIRWTTVTFTLSTHSAGGVTAKDVALARTIHALAAAQRAS